MRLHKYIIKVNVIFFTFINVAIEIEITEWLA